MARGVVELNDGYRVKNEELGPAGIPFVRGGDINGGVVNVAVRDHVRPEFAHRLHAKIVKPGDVAFITKGTVGRVGRVLAGSTPCVVAPQVCYWRAHDPGQLDPGFLYYLLCGREFQSALDGVKTHGSMVADYVSLSDQMSFRLTLPDPADQRAIARILGAVDDKIELIRRTNETLEAMARALFKSWFVDFDPVRAKAEGRASGGMDAGVAALFPEAFEESELGEIPRGWRVGPLSEVLDLDKGVSYKGEFLRDDGVPMVNLGCFRGDGVFDESRVKGYAGEVRDRHWVAAGDLVIANTDMTQNRVVLGSPGLVPRLGGTARAVFSHHVFAARFRSDPTGATKLYCYFALLQPEFRARAAGFASGTTVLALPRDAVLNLAVVTPPSDVRERFAGDCAPLLTLKQANADQSKTLATLRDLLLPKLLSGELRVRDADRIVERAL